MYTQPDSTSSKIDIVYLWVDGSDPLWRKKREKNVKKYGKNDDWVFANVEGRFRDNNELKYSLRSLMPFLHEIGNVFIVTDNQRPIWLNDHPKIKIIGVDPIGSLLADYHRTGNLGTTTKVYKIEGIGEDFLPSNVKFDIIDEFVQVDGTSTRSCRRRTSATRWAGGQRPPGARRPGEQRPW